MYEGSANMCNKSRTPPPPPAPKPHVWGEKISCAICIKKVFIAFETSRKKYFSASRDIANMHSLSKACTNMYAFFREDNLLNGI